MADLQGMQMVAAPAAAAPFTLSDPRPAGSSEPHPAAPAPAHPLLELAAADPSLNASALGKNAHVRLETKSDGDLSLHLMVHDGVVDVRFDGAAAHKLDLRPSEVRAALAGEGIAMGSFETSRSSSSQAVNQPNSTSSSGSQFGSNSNSNSNSNSSSFQSNSDSPGSSGGGASSAHTGAGTGSGFGSGTRNPDGGDRWANSGPEAGSHRPSDGASRSSPHGTSKSSDADQPPRRRGFHVTA